MSIPNCSKRRCYVHRYIYRGLSIMFPLQQHFQFRKMQTYHFFNIKLNFIDDPNHSRVCKATFRVIPTHPEPCIALENYVKFVYFTNEAVQNPAPHFCCTESKNVFNLTSGSNLNIVSWHLCWIKIGPFGWCPLNFILICVPEVTCVCKHQFDFFPSFLNTHCTYYCYYN